MCLNPLFEGSWIDVAGGRGGLINPLQIRPVPPDVDDNSDPVKKDSIGDLAVHLKTLQTFFRLYIPSMDDRLKSHSRPVAGGAVFFFRDHMGNRCFRHESGAFPDFERPI